MENKKEPLSIVMNEDCLEGMSRYPDKFFDLAIVDPPYGIGENKGQYASRNANRVDKRNGKPIIIRHKGYPVKDWDNERPAQEYFDKLLQVCKTVIIWGGNYFTDFLPVSPSWIVWDKVNGESDFSDCELAWTNYKSNSVRQIEYMWSGFCQGKSLIEGRINQGDKRLCERRLHPTQKPIALYKWLLSKYSQPTNKILDTHMGSQSSRIAAYNMGFDYYGWEIDKEYFEKGNKRFKEQTSQTQLF